MSNLFAGARDVKLFENGSYLTDGFVGVLEIERCLVKDTRASGTMYFAEMKIVESNLPNEPVGARRSWAQKMLDKQMAFANIKRFCMAASGIDPRDASKAEEIAQFDANCEQIMTESDHKHGNIFGGVKIRVRTEKKAKKNKEGETFTLYTFEPYVEPANSA